MKPTIAVIPHFNGSENLPKLLKSLEGQGYDETVILDDASAGRHLAAARETAREHNATFISGKENRGPGGNRNRIIESDRWKDTYLHFLDADVTLDSKDSAARVREELGTPGIGMGGGLIKNTDGWQMAWNFGPSFTLKTAVGAFVQQSIAATAKKDPNAAAKWRKRLDYLIGAWPDTASIQRTQPFFVAEANMYISSNTLKTIGGFPPIRFHDIHGPAIEIARRGLRTVFNPDIVATHHSEAGYSNQSRHVGSASFYILRHYGFLRFVFGGNEAK